ncbi:MAG TPA: FAD-binding oxidoreductase [Candidatus Angelobacter sp.]
MMITRREFISRSAALYLASRYPLHAGHPLVVNDIHSQLNKTRVDRVLAPRSVSEVQTAVREAKTLHKSVSIAGGRHAMGGQQFGAGAVLLDMRQMTQVIDLDLEQGTVAVQAGAFWPEVISEYLRRQQGRTHQWGIAQKQTGADKLSIGGTLAANAHGRGLTMMPFVSNIESFTLVNADGDLVTCSRQENPDLFRLAIGGYGLFGVVCSVKLRLVPRQKIERVVEVRNADGLITAFDDRIRNNFLYGDFQFAVDRDSDDFLRKGVFSCYRPVDPATPMPEQVKELSDESWRMLLYLAHVDKSEAFHRYADYYLSTNGQLYWSDTHQLSFYPENYHKAIDQKTHAKHAGTEMITEINVPRETLNSFLEEVREDFRKNNVELIYGTIRLIEKDPESFLPWAKQSYACTIFNLHTEHTPEGVARSAEAFRRLIDMAARRNGTYYLTYHRYAHRDQVLACYPQFPRFLQLKRKHDSAERFQSDWYRHYKNMFKDVL